MIATLAACGGGGGYGGGGTGPTTYSVGGTVTGLSGSGLVLRDNGGDNLAVWCPGTATQEGLSLVVERSELKLEAASLAGGEAGCAPNPNTGIRTISRLEVKVVGPLPIPAVCAHPLP
jgi:hypothetical protein